MSLNTHDPKSKKEDGLPDIANTTEKKPVVYVFLAIAILILGLAWILNARSHPSTHQIKTEETFAVNPEAPELKTNPSTHIPDKNTEVDNTKIMQTNSNLPEEAKIEVQKTVMMRLQAPVIVVNNQPTTAQKQDDSKPINDQNTQFLNDISNNDTITVQATVLHHRSALIAQGNLIHATLETAINSDLPGYLRAMVSEPVYSEDGSQILITPGSRLIGQYKNGLLRGENRVFVVWTCLIEPNGVSLQLGSPGVDSLGMAGQNSDEINHHFWQMFGTAALLSLIVDGASTVGVSASDQYNASQAYRQSLSQSFSQAANNSLQQTSTIPPTLHIYQGTPIIVFVARDLRFDQAIKQINTHNPY